MNRNAHCRIPGCESLSEIKFAQTWHLMSEPEKKLVRSFAGPPGIEDAPRTDATRDLVVETSYPTHGSLRLTMAPLSIRFAPALHFRPVTDTGFKPVSETGDMGACWM